MSFVVFVDGSANLPGSMQNGIRIIPCHYTMEGETVWYEGDIDHFDGHAFYESLRLGKKAGTSLINAYQFIESFEPSLADGQDVIYISMSSGISGTYHAACMAANELTETYPDRVVGVIDSRGCGFGNGLLAVRGAALNREGVSAGEVIRLLNEDVPHMCQYFTVDDLNFLKSTGRVSGATAQIATVLDIKPILYGNTEGRIVSCAKVRGRKPSIRALAKKYAEKVENAAEQTICISHGDCPQDAERLADLIREIAEPASIVISQHEPFSGSHVGPGMLGLFFYGKER